MAGDGGVADAQPGLGAGGQQPDGAFRHVDAPQDFLGFLQQVAARLGQPHLARRALEELRPHALFHFEDDAADRRLRHAQPFGGPVEVELFRHRHEGAEMLQVAAHRLMHFWN